MYKNPYKLLRDLIPVAPLQIGTVIDIVGGVATIDIMDGSGTAQARGEFAVTDRVFFRDGVIEGLAPNLTVEMIDV